METDVFYPNKLTPEEVRNLDGWRLKVATLHFGKQRRDCVSLGYGYTLRPEKFTDIRPDWDTCDEDTIMLVADNSGFYSRPISLRGEIDWNDPKDLLSECGMSVDSVLRDYVLSHIEEV